MRASHRTPNRRRPCSPCPRARGAESATDADADADADAARLGRCVALSYTEREHTTLEARRSRSAAAQAARAQRPPHSGAFLRVRRTNVHGAREVWTREGGGGRFGVRQRRTERAACAERGMPARRGVLARAGCGVRVKARAARRVWVRCGRETHTTIWGRARATCGGSGSHASSPRPGARWVPAGVDKGGVVPSRSLRPGCEAEGQASVRWRARAGGRGASARRRGLREGEVCSEEGDVGGQVVNVKGLTEGEEVGASACADELKHGASGDAKGLGQMRALSTAGSGFNERTPLSAVKKMLASGSTGVGVLDMGSPTGRPLIIGEKA
ncbi:hypothetical protein FB451DRAFT_1169890 [Mycena latifolia]|nr:hypothetical protein FB451DRAFT_1169890 [Mycena latifolia]